jgi:hypothetical protein
MTPFCFLYRYKENNPPNCPYDRQVLKALPYPINITTVQFAVGTVVALFMWITGILKRPKISGAQVNIVSSYGFSVYTQCTKMNILCISSYFPAFGYPSSGYCPYHGQSFHEHEPWKGCCVIHTYYQGYGTFLFGSPFSHLPWRGNPIFCFTL